MKNLIAGLFAGILIGGVLILGLIFLSWIATMCINPLLINFGIPTVTTKLVVFGIIGFRIIKEGLFMNLD